MVVGCRHWVAHMNIDDRVALWDAINAVVAASGGDTGNTSSARMDAVVWVDRVVDGLVDRRGWVCVRHRCAKHYDVPAQNTNEASGAECGGCIAEDLKRVDREYHAAAKAWAADRADLVRQRDESKRTADDNAYRAGTAMAERDARVARYDKLAETIEPLFEEKRGRDRT